MRRTLVASIAAIALSTAAVTGVMAGSPGGVHVGGFHARGLHAGGFHPGGFRAGGLHTGGFHPGAFQAGGMHARGLAVGHPAGAIYAGANRVSARGIGLRHARIPHRFSGTYFAGPAMAARWHGGWARPHYGWRRGLVGHRYAWRRHWHPHRYAWGLYAYRSASLQLHFAILRPSPLLRVFLVTPRASGALT
jgi:hypothetical protein